MCRERDSNPYSHFWPRDFKSLVSTNSTIAAQACHYVALRNIVFCVIIIRKSKQ